MVGFKELLRRLKVQDQMTKQHQTRLDVSIHFAFSILSEQKLGAIFPVCAIFFLGELVHCRTITASCTSFLYDSSPAHTRFFLYFYVYNWSVHQILYSTLES